MESNSLAMQVHCSKATADLLMFSEFKLVPRGVIEVKGKGPMETFWVEEDVKSEEIQTE